MSSAGQNPKDFEFEGLNAKIYIVELNITYMAGEIFFGIGFVLFAISMLIFNSKRLKKAEAFPYNENKKPAVSFSGFKYFIFLKLDKELTIYALLSWVGLIILAIGALKNIGII
jgi:hypothetical protein